MNVFPPLTLALSLATSAPAQVQWTALQPPASPSMRARCAMAFDEARDRVVLFGGLAGRTSATLADTWLFDGATWLPQVTPVAPPSRQWAMVAYDSARERVVLFGGMRWIGGTGWPWQTLDDTWEWDGNAWLRRNPATSPPRRSQAGIAFDPARGRVVLFGGYRLDLSGVVNFDDTWEWDGDDWTLVTPATATPSRRRSPILFFDSSRERVIMTGGAFDNGTGNSQYRAETWEWDGADWNRLAPATNPVAANGETIVVDSSRGRAVRYQGLANGRIYEWDGADWIARHPLGPAPPPRMDFNAAYDPVRQRVVAFGGRPIQPVSFLYADTWSYDPVHPATAESFGAGCAGSAGMPELRAEGRPWLGDTVHIHADGIAPHALSTLFLGLSNSHWAGLPLPLDLGPLSEAPGCRLLVAPEAQARLIAGAAPDWNLPLPTDAAFRGLSVFAQVAAIDLPANRLGLVLSDALTLTLGDR